MGLIASALLTLLVAILAKLLADECKAWAPSITAMLVRAAVRMLPVQMRDRFSEEWHSHLSEVPGDISKVVVACNFLLASFDIAQGPFGLRKRAFDLTLAIAIALFLAPLLALIGVSIKLDSPGPILLRRTRIGRNGKPFQVLKFRSSHTTRLGAFLRRCSLDELPLLFNVIAGDMSFVGPLTDDDRELHGPGMIEAHPDSAGRWSLTQDIKTILASFGCILLHEKDPDLERHWKWGLLVVSYPFIPLLLGLLRTIVGF
jgi:hypothetical protein